jgi:hypothetical protein
MPKISKPLNGIKPIEQTLQGKIVIQIVVMRPPIGISRVNQNHKLKKLGLKVFFCRYRSAELISGSEHIAFADLVLFSHRSKINGGEIKMTLKFQNGQADLMSAFLMIYSLAKPSLKNLTNT